MSRLRRLRWISSDGQATMNMGHHAAAPGSPEESIAEARAWTEIEAQHGKGIERPLPGRLVWEGVEDA